MLLFCGGLPGAVSKSAYLRGPPTPAGYPGAPALTAEPRRSLAYATAPDRSPEGGALVRQASPLSALEVKAARRACSDQISAVTRASC